MTWLHNHPGRFDEPDPWQDVEHEPEVCDGCHGTGEVHPTDRPYMNHEIHDCPECGGTGVAASGREDRGDA